MAGLNDSTLLTLPCVVISEHIVPYLYGRNLLKLEIVSRSTSEAFANEECWARSCQKLGYLQSGTRTRGRQTWRAVYSMRACSNCCRPGIFQLNTFTSGTRNNSVFSLCESCFSPSCQLFGLKMRLRPNAFLLQTTLARITATRRTILEEREAVLAKSNNKRRRVRAAAAAEEAEIAGEDV